LTAIALEIHGERIRLLAILTLPLGILITFAAMHVLIKAAEEVGPALFFSLLIITVSFLPIFALEAQEGRLFKPLAYTKTLAMAAAALLSVTLVPALMVLFIRGRITRADLALPVGHQARIARQNPADVDRHPGDLWPGEGDIIIEANEGQPLMKFVQRRIDEVKMHARVRPSQDATRAGGVCGAFVGYLEAGDRPPPLPAPFIVQMRRREYGLRSALQKIPFIEPFTGRLAGHPVPGVEGRPAGWQTSPCNGARQRRDLSGPSF
jgi:hypothetical protein